MPKEQKSYRKEYSKGEGVKLCEETLWAILSLKDNPPSKPAIRELGLCLRNQHKPTWKLRAEKQEWSRYSRSITKFSLQDWIDAGVLRRARLNTRYNPDRIRPAIYLGSRRSFLLPREVLDRMTSGKIGYKALCHVLIEESRSISHYDELGRAVTRTARVSSSEMAELIGCSRSTITRNYKGPLAGLYKRVVGIKRSDIRLDYLATRKYGAKRAYIGAGFIEHKLLRCGLKLHVRYYWKHAEKCATYRDYPKSKGILDEERRSSEVKKTGPPRRTWEVPSEAWDFPDLGWTEPDYSSLKHAEKRRSLDRSLSVQREDLFYNGVCRVP